MAEPASFIERLPHYRACVRAMLDRVLPPTTEPPRRLHDAMRYAVLNGGKRIRAILVIATGKAFQAHAGRLEPPACAVELIHAYSLIHDDLPSMDDDDLRRGAPACHRAFDEATALLAGDALQTLAFEILTGDPAAGGAPVVSGGAPDGTAGGDSGAGGTPAEAGEMVRTLAHASGSRGMAGGQAVDLESTGRILTFEQLEDMHLHKTGALIRASVRLGALGAGARDPELLDRLDEYARSVTSFSSGRLSSPNSSHEASDSTTSISSSIQIQARVATFTVTCERWLWAP